MDNRGDGKDSGSFEQKGRRDDGRDDQLRDGQSDERRPTSPSNFRREAPRSDADHRPDTRHEGRPFDRDRKPFDRDRKPADRDGRSFDRDRKPADRDGRSFDRDRKPADRDGRSFDRDRKPADRDGRSFDRDRKPADRDGRSFDRDRKPADRDGRSFDRDRKPADRDGRSFDRDRKPADRDGRSFDRDRKPADRDGRSFDRDRKPADRDGRSFDRDRKPADRDGRSFDRDRKPFDRERKPFDRDRPAGPREGGFRNRDMAAIQDLDEELLRLIMRRARVLAKLRVGDRLDPGVEKALRVSWEEKAAHHSRDSRLARDLFMLMQAVEPLSRQEEEQNFFNLAPRREPVDITMPAPPDSATVRSWLALAAASGQKLEMRGIALTDTIIDSVKAFNQLGGQLWWEENGVILSRGGKGLTSGLDKVIHVGDDAFNFWLVLALSLGVPSRLKLTGGNALRFLDLAPLRHFLVDMGTRLTNVIPSQDGLPARVECSGMLPPEVRLPSNLPAGFIAALVLAAPFWEKPVRMFVPAHSIAAVDAALHLLAEAGARASRDGDVVSVSPGPLTLPAEPRLAADVPFAASLLAIPAFVGGSVRLEGLWPMRRSDTDRVAQAEKLLRATGIKLTIENGFVSSHRDIPEGAQTLVSWHMSGEESAELLRQAPELLPLLSALSSASALQGATTALGINAETGGSVLSGFLSRLGLCLGEDGVLSTTMMVKVEPAEVSASAEIGESAVSGEMSEETAPVETTEVVAPIQPVLLEEREEAVPQERAAWISPSPLWAVGMALAAFARPHIHLANPGVMTELFPSFWNFYNGLPKPDLNRAKQVEEVDVKPVRRRIIAQGVYGEMPPEPTAGDDDWY